MTLRSDPELRFPLVAGETRLEIPVRGALISAAVRSPRRPKGTVVLIHGAASNASRWEEFAEGTALARDRRIVRLDLRGHGGSPSRLPGTLEDHAGDVRAVLAAAGAGRAVVVGHSLGAAVAMAFVRRFPEAAEGAALIDPLLKECLTPEAQAMRRRMPLLRAVGALGVPAMALGIGPRLRPCRLRESDERARKMIARGGEALEAFRREYSSTLRDLEHERLAVYARDLLEVSRPTPDLGGLRVPLLILAASAGAFTDADAMAREAARAGAECRTLRCLHWPITECLPDVEAALADWVGRL